MGGTPPATATVFDDTSVDHLTENDGTDGFLLSRTGRVAAIDQVLDVAAFEDLFVMDLIYVG